MKSSRSKRRRLLQSYIVPQRPDIPAIFESLNDDMLTTVLEFVGDKSYRSFGAVNKHCKEIYLLSGMTKETFLFGYGPLSAIKDRIEKATPLHGYDWELIEAAAKGVVFYNRRDVLEWVLEEQRYGVLLGICRVAAGEERFDILEEVWGDMEDEEDDKKYIFEAVAHSAAEGGKLDVLEWLETKDLELRGDLYDEAIHGGHLHVIKWLREQEVDWGRWTFKHAAEEGNLEVLQWLHNKGCPWPEDSYLRVYERRLNPEVVEWLRENGYSDRLI